MPRMLVVDDEPSICWGLTKLGEGLGCDVETASSAEQGLRLSSGTRRFDLVILDVRLPGVDGLTAMEEFRLRLGATPIIVITAFGDLGTAVRAVEQGAFEYVVKPFDLAEIRSAVKRALEHRRSVAEARRDAAERANDGAGVDGMWGRSPAMQEVFKRIALAARSESPVLIIGERGVGKELAARAIHRHSGRSGGPFVTVHGTSLNSPSADAELFGDGDDLLLGAPVRRGLVDSARGGVLFLDEPAELSPALQSRLLQALERGEATPPAAGGGSNASGIRLIAATTRELPRLVRAGEFRQDLFLRLSTFEIEVPALRDRHEDIPLLAERFASYLGRRSSGAATLSADAVEELQRRPWHGNVRELRRAIEHALVVARTDVVRAEHLPAPAEPTVSPNGGQLGDASLVESVGRLADHLLGDPGAVGVVYDRFLSEVEPPLLAAALARSGRQCAPAARALGLHRTTLKRKLEQYGMDAGSDAPALS